MRWAPVGCGVDDAMGYGGLERSDDPTQANSLARSTLAPKAVCLPVCLHRPGRLTDTWLTPPRRRTHSPTHPLTPSHPHTLPPVHPFHPSLYRAAATRTGVIGSDRPGPPPAPHRRIIPVNPQTDRHRPRPSQLSQPSLVSSLSSQPSRPDLTSVAAQHSHAHAPHARTTANT